MAPNSSNVLTRLATVDAFLKYNDFWGENTGAVILSELEVQDLDTFTDWILAEMKFKLLRNENS